VEYRFLHNSCHSESFCWALMLSSFPWASTKCRAALQPAAYGHAFSTRIPWCCVTLCHALSAYINRRDGSLSSHWWPAAGTCNQHMPFTPCSCCILAAAAAHSLLLLLLLQARWQPPLQARAKSPAVTTGLAVTGATALPPHLLPPWSCHPHRHPLATPRALSNHLRRCPSGLWRPLDWLLCCWMLRGQVLRHPGRL
jgi:hypothetical protein